MGSGEGNGALGWGRGFGDVTASLEEPFCCASAPKWPHNHQQAPSRGALGVLSTLAALAGSPGVPICLLRCCPRAVGSSDVPHATSTWDFSSLPSIVIFSSCRCPQVSSTGSFLKTCPGAPGGRWFGAGGGPKATHQVENRFLIRVSTKPAGEASKLASVQQSPSAAADTRQQIASPKPGAARETYGCLRSQARMHLSGERFLNQRSNQRRFRPGGICIIKPGSVITWTN